MAGSSLAMTAERVAASASPNRKVQGSFTIRIDAIFTIGIEATFTKAADVTSRMRAPTCLCCACHAD
jgi:hypothetical protein